MRILISAALLIVLGWQTSAAVEQKRLAEPERFTAFAISLGGAVTAPGTAQVEIAIDRWSAPAEFKQLLQALKEGQREAVETLRDLEPVGYIRTAQSLSYDLHYADQEPEADGGRHILLITDRPIGPREVTRQLRSLDYPFTLIELHMNNEGEGEGTLTVASRVTASSDGRNLHVLNYAMRPVLLKEVRRRN